MHKQAAEMVLQGGVIAYPTEGVYGFGCDPFNAIAVNRLLQLKQRQVEKGLILLTDDWQKVAHLILPIAPNLLNLALNSWAQCEAITWVFPANLELVPAWVRGAHQSIAMRITFHEIARALCANLPIPLISTSANIEGGPPARHAAEVIKQFPTGIDYILDGTVGNLEKSTPIFDVLTGKNLRL